MASEKSPMCNSLREQCGDEAGLGGQSVAWKGALSQPSASMRLIWKMGCAEDPVREDPTCRRATKPVPHNY